MALMGVAAGMKALAEKCSQSSQSFQQLIQKSEKHSLFRKLLSKDYYLYFSKHFKLGFSQINFNYSVYFKPERRKVNLEVLKSFLKLISENGWEKFGSKNPRKVCY